MSRIHSDDLFSLIKSLNQAEKRYFKVFASMGTSGEQLSYIKMFDLIEKQKTHDDKKLLKKLALVNPGQLSNQKKYLYQLVMESQVLFHSNKNDDASILKMIREIEILYNKRLLQQCLKLIHKAKAKAQYLEKHILSQEILSWEMKVYHEIVAGADDEKAIDTIFEQQHYHSRKEAILIDYKKLNNEIIKLFRKNGMLINNKEDIAKLKKIMRHPLLSLKYNAATYYEQVRYLDIHSSYYMMIGDKKNYYVYKKKLFELVELNYLQKKESPRNYLVAINNFTNTIPLSGINNEIETIFKKVKSLFNEPSYSKNPNLLLRLLDCYGSILRYYLRTGKFQEGLPVQKLIEVWLPKVGAEIIKTSEIVFYYNFAYLFFGIGNFKMALYWLNKILNEKSDYLRDDLQILARLLSLMVHFELKNEEVLENFAQSTYRFLHKKERQYAIENMFVEFIQIRLPKTNSQKALKDAFIDLKHGIKKISSIPQENEILNHFDFISWLDSKIENVSFQEIVKRKTLTNK